VDTEKLKHKQQVIEKALNERKPDRNDPIEILAKVGGLEMAAIAGAVSAAAARRVPVLLDGFICTTAALAAAKIHSHIAEYLIVGHRSAEPGHDVAIRALNKQPLLDLGLRLGEGSGAAVAFPILESAMKILKEMATFESAGVSGKSQ
jgi:nicotinate-nucleotide--dimethylbenzimidazole phosphoribosyltransferase